eukprot:jgi/Botrbrau1/21479/Bobra.0216s0087.1
MNQDGRILTSSAALKLAAGLGFGTAAAGAIAVGLYFATRLNKPGPVTSEEWFSRNSTRADFIRLLKEIADRGCEPGIRASVWPYLLHLFSPVATPEDRNAIRAECSKQYFQLLCRCQELAGSLEGSLVRTGAGVSLLENGPEAKPIPPHLAAFAEAQRIIVLDAIRTDLLIPNGQQGNGSGRSSMTGQASSGGETKLPWTSSLAEEALRDAAHLSPAGKRQAARLINLLTAYALLDPETGYCQGMSDLAAPFLLVFEEDAMAFTSFRCLMRHVRRNFRRDQAGIRQQLGLLSEVLERYDPVLFHHLRHVGASDCVFAYRMLLVLLRRELQIHEVLQLWEILWADSWEEVERQDYRGHTNGHHHHSVLALEEAGVPKEAPSLLTFFIAAVVVRQRRAILNSLCSDDVMRHFLQVRIDLMACLGLARRIRALQSPHLNGKKVQ